MSILFHEVYQFGGFDFHDALSTPSGAVVFASRIDLDTFHTFFPAAL